MTCSVNNDSRDDVLVERLLNSSDANACTIMNARKAPWKFPSVVLAF